MKTWGKHLQTWQSLKDATIPRVFAIDKDGRTVACIACISKDQTRAPLWRRETRRRDRPAGLSVPRTKGTEDNDHNDH